MKFLDKNSLKLKPSDFGEKVSIVNPKNKEIQHSIIIINVPIELTEEYLMDCLQNKYQSIKDVKRFVKNGKMLPIIKCNLNVEDNRNILSHGVFIKNCFYLPSPLLVIKKPTICYKCSQFGHISNNCSNTPKCLKCSDNHELKECKESKKHCPSCNGEHFGNDIKCQKYNEETKKN